MAGRPRRRARRAQQNGGFRPHKKITPHVVFQKEGNNYWGAFVVMTAREGRRKPIEWFKGPVAGIEKRGNSYYVGNWDTEGGNKKVRGGLREAKAAVRKWVKERGPAYNIVSDAPNIPLGDSKLGVIKRGVWIRNPESELEPCARRNGFLYDPLDLVERHGFTAHRWWTLPPQKANEIVTVLLVTSPEGEPGVALVLSVPGKNAQSWNAVEGLFYGQDGGGDDPKKAPEWARFLGNDDRRSGKRSWTRR